jgi:hypothetical protein
MKSLFPRNTGRCRLASDIRCLIERLSPLQSGVDLMSDLLALYDLGEELAREAKTVIHPVTGERVKFLETGGYWRYSLRQRRWKTRTFRKTIKVGRPQNEYARAFLPFLGSTYMRITGRDPTRGPTDGDPSQFESFACLMLRPFRVQGSRRLVREYIRLRRLRLKPANQSSMNY